VGPNTCSGHLTTISAYASQCHLQFYAVGELLANKLEKGQLLDLMGSVYLLNWNSCLHLYTIRIQPKSCSIYLYSAE